MPNNCYFGIDISGKPKDIKKFLKYFIYDKDMGNKKGKYLARTFIEEYDNVEECIKEKSKEIEGGAVFIYGWCAWSCYSCWIEGYPQDHKDCVKIEDICKKHKISIKAESEEGGMGFEELITCDSEGNGFVECYDMPEYECLECHETTIKSSCRPMEDIYCGHCDSVGKFKLIKKKELQ